MKTRTLLLLAVACGLAVLGAGVGLMVRLANQSEAPPAHRLGDAVTVGDARVIVTSSAVDASDVVVRFTVEGVDDPDGANGFALVAGGKLVAMSSSTCPRFTVASQSCEVRFDRPASAGGVMSLVLRRADERATWLLAG